VVKKNMKKILIIIHDMASGGAQRSLLSFLSEMEKYKDQYDLSLQVMKREGLFFGQIPSYLNLVETPDEITCMQSPVASRKFWKACDVRSLAAKLKWQFMQKRFRETGFGEKQQTWWSVWKNAIPESKTHYDVAISYMHGYTNYYLIDKVRADKKIMWIHTQYSESGRDVDFDGRYYSKADQIITVSETCAESFLKIFPDLEKKVKVILNISSRSLIWRLADMAGKPKEYESDHDCILVSIGRLSFEKGFDLALDAAKTLKESGCRFKWFFIGKGPLLDQLQKQRTMLGLDDCIVFLGEKSNPYCYLRHADIFVQTSRIEGKSIVLDEAKILCKPIVATEYDTITDNIVNREQGLIVRTDSGSIAAGIRLLIDNKDLRTELEKNLAGLPDSTPGEIQKYLQMLDE
jgi:glycosyltransferase involved in cell wall biosynthesis